MEHQQQFGKRKTYTPMNASQVCSSVAVSLNRDVSLSEHGLKTFSNILDVNQQQHIVDQKLSGIVYVKSIDGKVLMPTTSPKARRLLREHKAVVVKRNPFTIQLLVPCRSETQIVTLKIDTGYKFVGFSAITDKKELLSGELELENKTSKRLMERKMYRVLRRSKLWYRPARFNNREKKDGWLAPSIQHKLNSHINLVNKIKNLLPISRIIVEVASFDTQKMMNPEISGIEYQQGTLQGYEIREYLLEKYHRTCQYCQKTNIPLEVEHIISKARGGSNRVSNLTIACHPCNQKKDQLSAEEFGHPEIQSQALQSLKASAFMSILKKRIVWKLECESSYGYITKHNRIKLGLDKNHYNDAFSIGEISLNIVRCNPIFMKQKRHNNRSLQLNRNGFAPSIRRKRYAIQPHDLVWIDGIEYESKGTHCKGRSIIISTGQSINIKKIDRYYNNNSIYLIKKLEDRQFLAEAL